MGHSLKKSSFTIFIIVLFTISTVTMQVTVAFSTLSTEAAIKNSGLISYSQSSTVARPLRVEGNQIKNDLGETIYLRGFNVMGHFHDATSGAWGAWDYYDTTKVELVLNKLKSYNVNFVREMTNVQCWIQNPVVKSNIPNLKWRDMLKDFLARAREKGIYVSFVDYTVKPYPHHDFDSCGYGTWATGDERDVLPTRRDFISYAINRAAELGQFENYIAEFWNEPYFWSENAVLEFQATWQAIIDGLRAREFRGVILVQLWASLGTWINAKWSNLNWYDNYPLHDPLGNIVVSAHIYRQEGLFGDHVPQEQRAYTYKDLKAVYESLRLYEIGRRAPIVIGEIGGNIYYAHEDEFLANSLKIFNEWGIGYAVWNWVDKEGYHYQTLQESSRFVTGGTPNRYGQAAVDAIKPP